MHDILHWLEFCLVCLKLVHCKLDMIHTSFIGPKQTNSRPHMLQTPFLFHPQHGWAWCRGPDSNWAVCLTLQHWDLVDFLLNDIPVLLFCPQFLNWCSKWLRGWLRSATSILLLELIVLVVTLNYVASLVTVPCVAFVLSPFLTMFSLHTEAISFLWSFDKYGLLLFLSWTATIVLMHSGCLPAFVFWAEQQFSCPTKIKMGASVWFFCLSEWVCEYGSILSTSKQPFQVPYSQIPSMTTRSQFTRKFHASRKLYKFIEIICPTKSKEVERKQNIFETTKRKCLQ